MWDAPVLLCCGEDVPQRGHEVRRAVAEEPRQVDLHVARVQRLHGGMRIEVEEGWEEGRDGDECGDRCGDGCGDVFGRDRCSMHSMKELRFYRVKSQQWQSDRLELR